MRQAVSRSPRPRRRISPRLLTAEAFAALPVEGPADLVEGVVVPMSPTGRIHGQIVVRCARLLAEHVEARRLPLDVVCGEVGFVLQRSPDSVRGADVAVVRQQPDAPRREAEGFVEGPPDLVVEVRSPGNRPGEIDRKIADYLAAGAMVVWDVDPQAATVTVHRKGRKARALRGADRLDGGPVLPDLDAPVRAVFGE